VNVPKSETGGKPLSYHFVIDQKNIEDLRKMVNAVAHDPNFWIYELTEATTSATNAGIFLRLFIMKRPVQIDQGNILSTDPP
jgi:hypothetical protein